MEQNLSEFAKQIKDLGLSQEDTDFITATVNNETMTPEAKGQALSDYLDKKIEIIDEDEAKAGEVAIEKGQKDLETANTGFEKDMADLDREAEAAQK